MVTFEDQEPTPSKPSPVMDFKAETVHVYGRRVMPDQSASVCSKMSFALRTALGLNLMSTGGLTSLLDRLLLVDTLLLGFTVLLLSCSISKDDLVAQDGWWSEAFSNLDQGDERRADISLPSSFMLLYGELAVSELFVSIAIAISIYFCMSFSAVRESEVVADRFLAWFKLPAVLSFCLMLAGLVHFYMCFDTSLQAIYPLYCSSKFYLLQAFSSGEAIFDTTTKAMKMLSPEKWGECPDASAQTIVNTAYSVTIIVVIAALAVSFIINVFVHYVQADGPKGPMTPAMAAMLAKQHATFEASAETRNSNADAHAHVTLTLPDLSAFCPFRLRAHSS